MNINAFHPDYMKTYHPDFTKEFRTVEANKIERESQAPRKHVKKARVSVKIPKQGINTKAQQRMTMAEVTAELIKKTTFRIYSRAGVK